MNQVVSLLSLLLLVSACRPQAPETEITPTEDASAPYAGTRLTGRAPDFELEDQSGRSVQLSDLRGKAVLLTFLDSRCRDVCPRTSAELIATWLGLSEAERGQVAFLGVNVNYEANSSADVAAASRDWRLDQIPAWMFLTGSPADLQVAWGLFPVVIQPGIDGSIEHTSGLFVIDREGDKRWYISVPLMDPAWSGPRLAEILVRRLREVLGE